MCDVTDRQQVYETARRVKQNVGVVTILINNAGIVHGRKLLEADDAMMEKVVNVCLNQAVQLLPSARLTAFHTFGP